MDLQKRSFRFSGLDQSFNFGVSLRQFSLVDRSKSVLKLSFSGQSVRVLKRKSAPLQPTVTCEGEQLLDVKLPVEKNHPRTFSAQLDPAKFKAGSYDLLLHLHPKGDSVAMTKLHVFDASDVRQPFTLS